MIERVKITGYRRFRSLEFAPRPGFNILVGENESGKSTLLEAINLALTGRINGRSVDEELNPYWFNQQDVIEFFAARARGERVAPPEIDIEVFLEDRAEFLRVLYGAHNSEVPTRPCSGVRMRIIPSPEYTKEIEAYFGSSSATLIPVEYYLVDWRSFGDVVLTKRPKELTTAIIDSRTVRASSGLDYHLRSILDDHLTATERADMSLAFRSAKEQMAAEHFVHINEEIGALRGTLGDKQLSLGMDQSARSSWDASVVPHVDSIPFAMVGQGQQAVVKIVIAMGRDHAQSSHVVMIEEPDNHLSHTSLNRLLGSIQELSNDDQQLFVTTHSSFVLNRLGLDGLQLVTDGGVSSFDDMQPETVRYFQRLPGFDTLRAVLAKRVVMVEGPSDEIMFNYFYRAAKGCTPLQDEIDVISMGGLSTARGLELAKVTRKQCAILRDNDGTSPNDIRKLLPSGLVDDVTRQVFVGAIANGPTLEPQIVSANSETIIRDVLGLHPSTNISSWMQNNKTESALRIAESVKKIHPPQYFADAIEFISA